MNSAINLAQSRKNPTLQPLHLLAAGITNEFCQSFFQVFEINISRLKELADQELTKLPSVEGSQLQTDYALQDFLQGCKKQAEALNDKYITFLC